MSDESYFSLSEDSNIAKKNGNPTGSDESYVTSGSDPDSSIALYYQYKKAPGKIRGRRGKAKKILSPDEADSKRLLANTQERDRMDKLNFALEKLRDHLPHETMLYNRKLSKIRTLTVATNYIAALSQMIHNHDSSIESERSMSSCLYASRADYTYYTSQNATPSSYSLGDSRLHDQNNFEAIREQSYSSTPLFSSYHPPGLYRKVSPEMTGIHQYESPEQQGSFPHALARAIRSDVISEMPSFDFYTSTPRSSRDHPYDRR